MRRAPKRTTEKLSEDVTGVIHFADTTGGNAKFLCDYPLKYPLLIKAVLPLYLSVVRAFMTKFPATLGQSLTASCTSAEEALRAELSDKEITVRYNTGVGNLTWNN
jgi:hypothetical protein